MRRAVRRAAPAPKLGIRTQAIPTEATTVRLLWVDATLAGAIPTELGQLLSLETLRLQTNKLIGKSRAQLARLREGPRMCSTCDSAGGLNTTHCVPRVCVRLAEGALLQVPC